MKIPQILKKLQPKSFYARLNIPDIPILQLWSVYAVVEALYSLFFVTFALS